MARMHARKKGKSRSKPPVNPVVPKWLEYKKDEVEELVLKLLKEGLQTAQIGLLLRDQYGIPDVKVITGKKISKIIEDKEGKSEYPEDFMNLLRRAVNLRKHLAINTRDRLNKRSLILIESKIKRLEKYYKKEGILPQNFYYNPEQAALLIK
jgi:small subunit ribosomal protein S15